MNPSLSPELKQHYLEFSTFTNPGLYKQGLINNLPDDIRETGLLVRQNIIHRTTLAAGNVDTNADLRFGDMTKMPWWKQPEDDILPTAAAMLAELYFRDKRGFIPNRAPEHKLILTCRNTAIIMAAILKSKGIPTRVRAGFAPYFEVNQTDDHWINQYWNDNERRWVTIDVDGSLSLADDFDPYDVPNRKFNFAAKSWLDIREDKVDANRFYNAGDFRGQLPVAWALFWDFHCLMNSEVIYLHHPELVLLGNFDKITNDQLKQIDELAKLMLDPDDNFDGIRQIWNTNKQFRLLKGGLL